MILHINDNILGNLLKKSSKTLQCLFFSSLFILIPFNSAGASQKDRWFEIEVIVFANNDETLQEVEKWPEKPGSPAINNVLDVFTQGELLFDNVEQLPAYYAEALEPSENNLSALANKIKKNSKYTLLTHRSWRQTAPLRKAGIPVYLDDNASKNLYQPVSDIEEAGDVSSEQLLLDALLAEETKLNQPVVDTPFYIHQLDPIEPFDEVEDMPNSVHIELSPMGPPNHAVFGTLNLFKSRFLHLDIDLLYRMPPNEPKVLETIQEEVFPTAIDNNQVLLIDQELVEQEQSIVSEEVSPFTEIEKLPLTGFRLKGSKRIRLNEVHYFDHPLFGVIVRTIRYKEPEPEVKNPE